MATSGQIGQLSAELGISTEQATTDLNNLEGVIKNVKDGLAQLGITSDTFGEKTEKAGASIRKFRQEHMLQRFEIREAIGVVTSLSFALAFLTQGNEKASEAQKTMSQAMLGGAAAAQATEFALFGLSRAIPALAAAAGPLSLIIGAIAAVWTYMQKAKAEAEKVTVDLKKTKEELGIITTAEMLDEAAKKLKEAKEAWDKTFSGEKVPKIMPGAQLPPGPMGEVAFAPSTTEMVPKYTEADKQAAELAYNNALIEQQKVQKAYYGEINKEAEKHIQLEKSEAETAEQVAKWDKDILEAEQARAAAFEKGSDEAYWKLLKEIQKRHDEEAKEALAAAEKKGKAEIRMTEIVADLESTAIRDQDEQEKKQQDLWYTREKDRIEKAYKDGAAKEDALARLKEANDRITDERLRNSEARSLDAADNLASVLQSAFSRSGDTLLSKLMQALQVAIRIAQAINTSTGSAAGVMGIISSIIPGLGLLFGQKGADEGLIVPGIRGAPQLILAHSGETILPTHKYSYAEAYNRVMTSPQRFDSGGFVGSSVRGGGGAGQIIIRGKVDLSNGTVFFRQESRTYERWKDKKLP